jgi:hypothetical protein
VIHCSSPPRSVFISAPALSLHGGQQLAPAHSARPFEGPRVSSVLLIRVRCIGVQRAGLFDERDEHRRYFGDDLARLHHDALTHDDL